MNIQEQLIDIATKTIADRLTMEDTLQDKVVNMDIVPGSVGITFLNKDGSYFIEVFTENESDSSITYTNSAMNKDLYHSSQI